MRAAKGPMRASCPQALARCQHPAAGAPAERPEPLSRSPKHIPMTAHAQNDMTRRSNDILRLHDQTTYALKKALPLSAVCHCASPYPTASSQPVSLITPPSCILI